MLINLLELFQVAYAIVWLKPSWHCGPFATYDRMYKVFTEKILDLLPERLHGTLDYITSPGIVIPTFVLMVLIIYYLISLTGLLRESNDDLKNQVIICTDRVYFMNSKPRPPPEDFSEAQNLSFYENLEKFLRFDFYGDT